MGQSQDREETRAERSWTTGCVSSKAQMAQRVESHQEQRWGSETWGTVRSVPGEGQIGCETGCRRADEQEWTPGRCVSAGKSGGQVWSVSVVSLSVEECGE